jgi:hypothetical protein
VGSLHFLADLCFYFTIQQWYTGQNMTAWPILLLQKDRSNHILGCSWRLSTDAGRDIWTIASYYHCEYRVKICNACCSNRHYDSKIILSVIW